MNRDYRPRSYRDIYASDDNEREQRHREESAWQRRPGGRQLEEDVYAGTRNDQGFGSFGRPFGELYERDDPSWGWSSRMRGDDWRNESRRPPRQARGERGQQHPWGERHASYYDDELAAGFDENDTSGYAQGYAGYGQGMADTGQQPRRPWTSPGGYGPSASQGPYRAWQGSSRPSGYGAQGEHRGKGPVGYRRSDERIREDVCEALTVDPWLDASNVQVNVNDGVVTLQGTVSDRYMKHRAEDCADQASGVRDVENRIRVASQGSRTEPEQPSLTGGGKTSLSH